MASVHTWAGLIPGWIVFLVFLFGTAAYFQHEINGWMRPEVREAAVSPEAWDAADAILADRARGAESWTIELPNPRGGNGLTLSWPQKGGGEWSTVTLDPASGRELSVRATKGGEFFYTFHYNLHYLPHMVGRYAIVIAALAMLVAILSGIITHKKIFADFFLLRFGKGQRSWLDAHNVTSVLALPFHLMITYTGLVIFSYMLFPSPITTVFDSEDSYYDEAYPSLPHPKASGRAAVVVPLSQISAQAQAAWGRPASSLSIDLPGDAAAIATAAPIRDALGRETQSLHFSAVTGAVLPGDPEMPTATMVSGTMIQLHAGWFAAPVLRWLYFAAGAGGTVMISTGLILWTVKRRARLPDPQRPHFGFRLVERLNIGVIAGAPAGIAIYFLANRLLPLGLAQRAEWEVHSLFIAWGALFVWSLGRPARRAWTEVLAAGAALYALVPIVSAATTTRGLIPSLIARDWRFVAFELIMFAMSGLFALAALRVANHKPKVTTRRANRAGAAVA